MSVTICAARGNLYERGMEDRGIDEGASESTVRESHGWMTKQVIAACLWSAFFGLLCGYGWMFLHVSLKHMSLSNGYTASVASPAHNR
jgi:hypothetical protein